MLFHECTCDHGQVFDNRKRWCSNCEETVDASTKMDTNYIMKASIMCPQCGAVWPEYVESYLEEVKDNPLYKHLFETHKETWH